MITEAKSSQKESSFANEMPLIKSVGGGWSAVARDTSKICGFVPQEHQDYDAFWRTRKDLEEITADLSLRRNNLFQSLGYYRPVCLYFCVQQNSGASHPHCTSLKMHNPSGIHSMNVSGDPTPVIIDQVREIRFQRQANCIFLRVLTLWWLVSLLLLLLLYCFRHQLSVK